MNRKIWIVLGIALAAWVLHLAAASAGPLARPESRVALGTGFTYQGRLDDGAGPVDGECDMAFRLYDAGTGGSQVGGAINATVPISDGLFTVVLNAGGEFGPTAFAGDARWLGIQVKCQSDSSFTDLGRQELTAAPYALYAQSAPWGGLTGMPGGFADGVDNNTTYTAGTGLTLSSGAFSADTAYLQRRVSSTCPAGQAIRIVGADGTVTCEQDDDTDTTYTAGDGLALVGTQFRGEGTAYQNVVIVAKSGGDYASIQAALDSITDAAADNRYLVWVAPGIYVETVTMEAYVDIAGAGELATKITYTGSTLYDTGTVVGADNAELRFLTVENTGGNEYAIAIYNNSSSPRLAHVTVIASGGASNRGVYNYDSSSPAMTGVTASASGGSFSYGVWNHASSSPTMRGVTASASGGANNDGVYNQSSSPTMIDVTASASGGTNNFGVTNSHSSPTMTGVTASASGGTESYGVYNTFSSSPTMTNVTASASEGTTNCGVYNNDSSPTMTGVTASASGGTYSYGVFNYGSSSPTIQNSVLIARWGTGNFGIYNSATSGSHTVTVNHCQVTGSTTTIANDDEFTTLVGASLLSGGPVVGSGTVTCAGVYDETYTWFDSACP